MKSWLINLLGRLLIFLGFMFALLAVMAFFLGEDITLTRVLVIIFGITFGIIGIFLRVKN